jgi:hypothetical protein
LADVQLGAAGFLDTDVQRSNRDGGNRTPTTYNWPRVITLEPLTKLRFEEIDRRFIQAGLPCLTNTRSFDRIMPDDCWGK